MQERRIPPQDIGSEQAALGAALIDEEAARLVFSLVSPEDFYRMPHRAIARAMWTIMSRREPVDLMTVASELRRMEQLEECGGPEYLVALTGMAPTAAHARKYALDVLRASLSRSIIAVALETADEAYGNPAEPQLLAEECIRRLESIQDRICKRGAVVDVRQMEISVDEMVARELRWEEERPHFDIPKLDSVLRGLTVPGLTVIKGYRGSGKTALMDQCLLHWCINHEQPAIVFKAEMDLRTQSLPRWAKSIAAVGPEDFRSGEAGSSEGVLRSVLERSVEMLSRMPLLHVMAPRMTPTEVCGQMRPLVRESGARLVVVDYLQRLAVSGREWETREAIKAFKDAAMEHGVALVVGSQVTIHDDGRTVTKNAAAIEDEADIVLSLNRFGKTWIERQTDRRARIVVEKNRQGPNSWVDVLLTDRVTWREIEPEQIGPAQMDARHM